MSDKVYRRENSLRRLVVMCNVKGRDIGSLVRDAQQAVALQVTMVYEWVERRAARTEEPALEAGALE